MNNLKYNKLCYIWFCASLSFPFALSAGELRHQITEDGSPESLQTNTACRGFWNTNKHSYCLPSNYIPANPGRISLDFLIKADSHSFEILRRVYENKLDQKFVDELFKKNNFGDVSGSAQVQAVYKQTRFSFMPMHFLGGYKLINPSLPEVHVNAVRSSVLRISHLFQTDNWFLEDYYRLFFSPDVINYNRKFFRIDSEIFTFIGRSPKDLIDKKSKIGWDMEVKLGVMTKSAFLPSIFLSGKNLFQESPCIDCERPIVDIEPYYQTLLTLHTAWQLAHPIGESIISFALPFSGYFQQVDDWNSSMSYIYQISKMGMYTSFSPLRYSFGFILNSDSYKIGLMYTDEKQENSLAIEREKETYVFTSVYL